MSQQTTVLNKSFKASIDLDTKQYFVVKMATSGTPMGVTLASSETDVLIGVLQNEPKMNEAAVVAILGTTKAIAGTPIAIGDKLTVDSGGRVVPALTDLDIVIGFALETATGSPQAIEILLTHFSLNYA